MDERRLSWATRSTLGKGQDSIHLLKRVWCQEVGHIEAILLEARQKRIAPMGHAWLSTNAMEGVRLVRMKLDQGAGQLLLDRNAMLWRKPRRPQIYAGQAFQEQKRVGNDLPRIILKVDTRTPHRCVLS